MALNRNLVLTVLIAVLAITLSFFASKDLRTVRESIKLSLSKYIQNARPYNINATFPKIFDSKLNVTYVGTKSDVASVELYRGIFYAEDTSGQNRFAPPVPRIFKFGSTIDARRSGAWCPQPLGGSFPFTSTAEEVSENCLSLQITTSSRARLQGRVPVVVYIHGGGNVLGSGADKFYQSDKLVESAGSSGKPIVFVTFNYRLGIFGFAANPALVKASSANVALRDQRAALEWIRDHIEAFGGDVTVLGHGAGGLSIGHHLLSFGGTKGVPFQKAYLMSGSPGLGLHTKSSVMSRRTAELGWALGCGQDLDPEAAIDCLRQVPMNRLREASISAAVSANPPYGEMYFGPTFDGDFIKDRPSELNRRGSSVRNIPLLISWVTNDGAWYAPQHLTTDDAISAILKSWLPSLSNSTEKKLLSLYTVSDFEHMVRPIDNGISPQYYRAAQIIRDVLFVCPSLDFAFHYARNSGGSEAPVFVYEHNTTKLEPYWQEMGVPMWRVSHLSDVPFLLDNIHVLSNDSERDSRVRGYIIQHLLHFAYYGDPSFPNRLWVRAFEGVSSWNFWWRHMSRLYLTLLNRVDSGQLLLDTVEASEKTKGSEHLSEAARAVHDEKLFDRCALINSQKFRREAGV